MWSQGASFLARRKRRTGNKSHPLLVERPANTIQTIARSDTAVCKRIGCNRTFTGEYANLNLRRHIREDHEDRQFECPTGCGQSSTRLGNLRKHWERKHGTLPMPELLKAARGAVTLI
jgi:hypothetical protein